jgi:hypothetical protein
MDTGSGGTAPSPEENRFCASCGVGLEPGSAFCPDCGDSVGVASRVSVTPTAASSWPTAIDETDPQPPAPQAASLQAIATPAIGATAAFLVGVLVTLCVTLLAGIDATRPYLAEFVDLTFATPVLLGFTAGYFAGHRQLGVGRARAWYSAVAASLVAAAALLFMAQNMGGYLRSIVAGGWFALGSSVTSSSVGGWLLVLALAAGSGYLGWRAALGHRTASAIALVLSAIILSFSAPMAWRIYHLMAAVGSLR